MSRITKIRDDLEASIVSLAAERAEIDGELRLLVKMLAAANKVIGKKAKPGKKPKAKPVKKLKNTGMRNAQALALELLAVADEVTPALFAKKADLSLGHANNVLIDLAKAGKATRLRRGVYGGV